MADSGSSDSVPPAEEGDNLVVSFAVDHIEPVRAGRLVAIATVSIDVNGVEFRIQGVRIIRRADGLCAVEAPQFRRPGGQWVPAVTLPDALKNAIAAEILERVEAVSNSQP